jgi:hypothetical protein
VNPGEDHLNVFGFGLIDTDDWDPDAEDGVPGPRGSLFSVNWA